MEAGTLTADFTEEDFFIDIVMELYYAHEDPTVAYVENNRLQPLAATEKTEEDATKFDEAKFDRRFRKYFQIINSDFTNFFTSYTCFETAEFESKKTR